MFQAPPGSGNYRQGMGLVWDGGYLTSVEVLSCPDFTPKGSWPFTGADHQTMWNTWGVLGYIYFGNSRYYSYGAAIPYAYVPDPDPDQLGFAPNHSVVFSVSKAVTGGMVPVSASRACLAFDFVTGPQASAWGQPTYLLDHNPHSGDGTAVGGNVLHGDAHVEWYVSDPADNTGGPQWQFVGGSNWDGMPWKYLN